MSLSTLIVQREIASIREVEEALARQVLYGGDLITNLLEVCRLDEAQLLPIVAEALGLSAAPSGELPRPAPEAMRLVAAETAVQHDIAPLSVDRYGLVLAVAQPLSADLEQELSFALAMPISQKVAPLIRIKQALTRDYGVPLESRLQRLLQRMMTDGPRSSSSFPPMRNADLRLGAPRPPSIQPPMPSPVIAPPVRASVAPGGVRRTLVRTSDVPAARPLRRRRGAFAVEVARTELEEAGERDTIFDLLFEFARQYFDYTAVFIVHGDVAGGRDAFGDGAAREKVARIDVPLDLPSILAAAREKGSTLQKVPTSEGIDAILMNDLGRSGKTICVVLPVVVRTRVVAMLLGDGGDAGVDAAALADVEGVIAQASAAFERLVVRRKLKGSLPPGKSESVVPRNTVGFSAAPPTRASDVSDRPSIEELAPPIRDLMMEPRSRVSETRREPDMTLTTMTTPSNLGPAAAAAQAVVQSSASPRSRARRGQAPKLEFNAIPAPSSSLGGEMFGADETERQLLAEIHGRPSELAPATSRDSSPPLHEAQAPVVSPLSSEVEPPRSSVEPSYTAPVQPSAITDRSPGALPLFSAADPPPSSESHSSEIVHAEDSDVSVVEPDSSPYIPIVDMDGVTPLASALPATAAAAPATPVRIPEPRASGRIPLPEPSRPMPVSEQQISVAAHRPPSSRSDHSNVLPSVIVDVASEYVGLVDRVLSPSTDASAGSADDAETELLRAGGPAMPAIMAQFPGPVTIERERLSEGPLPRVAECGPVLRLVASQRRTALPFVLSHVEDADVANRFWATYLLTELIYPETLEPILLRVFDDAPRVRRAARAAARAFADTHPVVIVERLELIAMDPDEARERRMLAIEALGETRQALAVPALIPLLDDPDVGVVTAVRGALVTITRHDFGTSSQKWSGWWTQNYDRHRIEWLIDALMNDQAALRATAGEELKNTTKEYFGYYDDLPKRERERAQSRYREWWESVGRVRFSRSASSRG